MFILAHQFCSIRGERSQHNTYPHQTGAQLGASVYEWRPDATQDVLVCTRRSAEAKQDFSRKHLLSRLRLGPRRSLNWICCNWSYSSLIRIAYICLVAFCCSGAFANTHQIAVSDSHLDLARSQRALPTPDILRHRALPPAEPFVLPSPSFPTGEMRARWSDLEARISADERLLATCRSDQSKCSQAESRFLSIVELARKHEGRARLGWLNRAVNMSIKPVSDWVQYGDADYWASPLQTLGNGTGDCEDYAIIKYVALRAVGVEADNLRLVIVQNDKRQTQHAVVAVRYEQQWLILDNLTMVIITAEDARNYRPLFTLYSSRAVAVGAADPARIRIE